MKYIRNFFVFWYHFIIGDDWTIALAVGAGFGAIALLVHKMHVQLWWLLPAVVIAMLTLSLWLEVRRRP